MSDDLGAMRRSYDRGGLEEEDLAPTWLDQLTRWLAEARSEGAPEPNAMVLATAGAGGAPGARTVLLKGVDERGLTFFTNLRSRKARELSENPRAALVFPWISIQRQVVVDGRVEPVDGRESDRYFASRPRGAQLGALASPQSEAIASRTEIERRYAELADEHPGDVPRPEWWGGLRLIPEAVEFWQGRPERMHDRLRFRRTQAGTWIVERLAP